MEAGGGLTQDRGRGRRKRRCRGDGSDETAGGGDGGEGEEEEEGREEGLDCPSFSCAATSCRLMIPGPPPHSPSRGCHRGLVFFIQSPGALSFGLLVRFTFVLYAWLPGGWLSCNV